MPEHVACMLLSTGVLVAGDRIAALADRMFLNMFVTSAGGRPCDV
jgi:hypothetical protein